MPSQIDVLIHAKVTQTKNKHQVNEAESLSQVSSDDGGRGTHDSNHRVAGG